ncbi:MAG: M23 family metallopeptidase [Aureispira sp.]|nr:M23 family metallopeptidase [Aureispira sp.]
MQEQKKLRLFREAMGLSPFKTRMKQAKQALFGQEDVPPTKWGLSSLSQLHPRISPKLWRGKPYVDRKVIISNFFNHTQTPIEEGWSVRKNQVKDFRGGKLTYNSHNGTDFAIPVGTTVSTAAAGEVVAVMSEFNRGGLKVFIDHGEGLMTCYAHLGRSLVEVGDILDRGQAIALSGYSGLDAMVTFPFGIPHVHFNVWHNCEPIDPFPYEDLTTLWMGGQLPTPPESKEHNFQPSVYNADRVEEAINACKTAKSREKITAHEELKYRAAHTIIEMNYYPTRFESRINIYEQEHPRKPSLDLPFSIEDFDGVVFLDEMKSK